MARNVRRNSRRWLNLVGYGDTTQEPSRFQSSPPTHVYAMRLERHGPTETITAEVNAHLAEKDSKIHFED